jgi:hypothetical protein
MRATALAALIAAGLLGGWARWEQRQDTPPRSLNALNVLAGRRLPHGAIVEEVSSHPVEWVRLRLEGCPAPAFLFLDSHRVEFDAGGVNSLLCIFQLQDGGRLSRRDSTRMAFSKSRL